MPAPRTPFAPGQSRVYGPLVPAAGFGRVLATVRAGSFDFRYAIAHLPQGPVIHPGQQLMFSAGGSLRQGVRETGWPHVFTSGPQSYPTAMIGTGASFVQGAVAPNEAELMMTAGLSPASDRGMRAAAASGPSSVAAPLDMTFVVGGGVPVMGLEYRGVRVEGLAERSLQYALTDGSGNVVGSVSAFYPNEIFGDYSRVGVELYHAISTRRGLRVALADRFGVRPSDVDISEGLPMMVVGAGYYMSGAAAGTRTIVLNEDIDAPRAAMIAHYLEWWRIGELEVQVDGYVFNMKEHSGPSGLERFELRRGEEVTFTATAAGGEMLLQRIAELNEAGWFSADVKHPDVLRIAGFDGPNKSAQLAGVAFDMMEDLHVESLNGIYEPKSGFIVMGSPLIGHDALKAQLPTYAGPVIRFQLQSRHAALSIGIINPENGVGADAEAKFRSEFGQLFRGVGRRAAEVYSTGGLVAVRDHSQLISETVAAVGGRTIETNVDEMMASLETGELTGAYIPRTRQLVIGDPRLYHAELAERLGLPAREPMIRLHFSIRDDAIVVIPFDGATGSFSLDPDRDYASTLEGMTVFK